MAMERFRRSSFETFGGPLGGFLARRFPRLAESAQKAAALRREASRWLAGGCGAVGCGGPGGRSLLRLGWIFRLQLFFGNRWGFPLHPQKV